MEDGVAAEAAESAAEAAEAAAASATVELTFEKNVTIEFEK